LLRRSIWALQGKGYKTFHFECLHGPHCIAGNLLLESYGFSEPVLERSFQIIIFVEERGKQFSDCAKIARCLCEG